MYLRSYGLPLAILSTCVTAFYPYSPKGKAEVEQGDGGATVKRSPFYPWNSQSSGASSSETHGESITLNIRRAARRDITKLRDVLGKRENGYKVEKSDDPSQPGNAAVDQDGTDFSYFTTVQVGSSGTELLMLIDTGAANTWVMGSDCVTKACKAHTTFGKAKSSSHVDSGQQWTVTYGTGSVSGVIVKDTMSIAGFDIPMSFGSASNTTDDFLSYPMDGILGLGRTGSNELAVPTMMDVLARDKKLKTNVLGINLHRHSDGLRDGQITIGDWDKSRFEGDLSWTDSVSEDGLWEIPLDGAGVGGKSAQFSGKSAIIDTGTSYILLPPKDARQLHAQFPKFNEKGETFELPCSSTEPVELTFSGVTYEVSPKDYLGKEVGEGMCKSNIFGHQTAGADQWLLGDSFLKNVYSVFDYDKDRIGFATKASSEKPNSQAKDEKDQSSPTGAQSPTSSSASSPKSTSSNPPSPSLEGLLPPSKSASPSKASSDSTDAASSDGSSVDEASPLNPELGANPQADSDSGALGRNVSLFSSFGGLIVMLIISCVL
ncbi:MAG: hypothetical protein M1833_002879 [Piccolia ochrophora]|nr:MAG: hypothetical protein M1833_002879 [Piccolia ochrophora]